MVQFASGTLTLGCGLPIALAYARRQECLRHGGASRRLLFAGLKGSLFHRTAWFAAIYILRKFLLGIVMIESAMAGSFKRGDHVAWNSEAGRVSGVILKKIVSDIRIKGYVHHASKQEPQYLIKSDKTDHVAIHRGKALRRLKPRRRRRRSKIGKRKT